ncbi:MAG: hypothetical protein SF187_29140 [Deltaproteobacteria bacterium]|nr:hypothetical protein [Deltaproteobacteria bacterium]
MPGKPYLVALFSVLLTAFASISCGSDETEADKRGVGASCSTNADCSEKGQTCLAFKGGYCGVADCVDDTGCPAASACVKHTDGKNYCFRTCVEKPDCNANRPVESEANCSSNPTLVSGAKNTKVCVPPSGS